MRTAVDLAADLAEEIARRPEGFDRAAFVDAYQRAQPALVLYDAVQFTREDPIEYQRLRRRSEALAAVVAELEHLGEQPAVATVLRHWRRFARSPVAEWWRSRGGPGRDANVLDSALFRLHLHNRWRLLSARQLHTLLGDPRPVEARSTGVGPCP